MTQVTIKRLGVKGDGIAEGPLFVSRCLPGEIVSGTLDRQTLTAPKIITPSDDRVSPPCRHYKSCGGCQVQHATDDFVAGWKTDVVRQALKTRGLGTDFRAIETSPPFSRRRAGFSARRTKKGALVGFHGRASDTIVAIPDCHLLLPEVRAGASVAEALAMAGASRKTALSVLVTYSPKGLDVVARGGKPLDSRLRQALAAICESASLARLSWDDEVVALRAAPTQVFGPADVVPPPGAFLQATQHGQDVLTAAVLEITQGAKRVVDLFAGCGTFSLPLAQHAQVHAVEGDAAMIKALDAGWRHATGVRHVSSEVRDLFRRPLMADEFAKVDAVVIDPPRAGAEAQGTELSRSGVARIAYVSCNPVTFARDAAVLVDAGYSLEWIQVVDQFRWSAHVELVACLTKSHMR